MAANKARGNMRLHSLKEGWKYIKRYKYLKYIGDGLCQ